MLRRLALALICTLLVTGLRPSVAHAHAQKFTIAVGRNGFENSVDYTLDVEAGHEVTLTFTYADGDLADDNPHELKIKGPGLDSLPTVTISRDHPTATITFTPNKTGTLHIVCIVPCIGMERLVGGQMKVVKPKATGVLTFIMLDLSPRDDGDIRARATLQDSSGRPIANVPVIFTLHTSLGGDLVLDTPTAMEGGSVVIKIRATGSEKLNVTASFDGGNGFAYSEASSEITSPGRPMRHEPGPLSAPSAPPALALALLVVLGGVWATYGFVAYQVVRIGRG